MQQEDHLRVDRSFGDQVKDAHTNTSHPVEKIQKEWKLSEKQLKLRMTQHVFGSHMPLRFQMEEYCARRAHVPQLSANGVVRGQHTYSLDILTSFDDEFGFEDYLNDPRDSEEQGVQFYEHMEAHMDVKPLHQRP
jgi:proteasome maturation protein